MKKKRKQGRIEGRILCIRSGIVAAILLASVCGTAGCGISKGAQSTLENNGASTRSADTKEENTEETGTKESGTSRSDAKEKDSNETDSEEIKRLWEQAENTPYEPYPETVTYTLAKTVVGDGNMPVGDTFEQNAYTRYLEKTLHIKNENILAAEQGENYSDLLSILADDGELPDIAVVRGKSALRQLVDRGLLADLSDSYIRCTTPRIREMYESYGPELLEGAKVDGVLYAFPDTIINHGPDMLWLRKDWIDRLGLAEPTSLREAMDVIREFAAQKVGGEETIGLALSPRLFSGESDSYGADGIFADFGASPLDTIYGQRDGGDDHARACTKQALIYMNELYKNGTIDPHFLLRTDENIEQMIENGTCGAIFGKWWAPNNPLNRTLTSGAGGDRQNGPADWKPYVFGGSDRGTYVDDETRLYVVARRGFSHPELIAKQISVLFDKARYEEKNATELNDYFSMNVDPTARPLSINVDYIDALYRVREQMENVRTGRMSMTQLTGLEKAYYRTCRSYMDGTLTTADGWAAYTSRIVAVDALKEAGVDLRMAQTVRADNEKKIDRQQLCRLCLSIIVGETPVEAYDTYGRNNQ